MNEDAAREIFPVTLEDDDNGITDFRPLPIPADTPDEEEVPDPKEGSAPESADSEESTPAPKVPLKVPTVPPSAGSGTSPLKVSVNGSSTS